MEEFDYLDADLGARNKKRPDPVRKVKLPWGTVYGSFRKDILEEAASLADMFLSVNREVLGGELTFPINLHVMTKQQMLKQCKKCKTYDLPGFYDTDTQEVSWAFSVDHERQGILAHELTHAYSDSALGLIGPPWFAEGLASYFEFFSMKDGHAIPGQIPGNVLWEAYKLMKEFPLEEMLKVGFKDFYKTTPLKRMDDRRFYTVGLAFVHFLAEQEGFHNLVERVRSGQTDDLLNYEGMFRDALEVLANPGPPPGDWVRLIPRG